MKNFKKDKCGGVCNSLVWLFLFVIFLILVGNKEIRDWTNENDGLASWIQAIGSIVAIAFAIYIPYSIRERDIESARVKELADAKNNLDHYIIFLIKLIQNFSNHEKVISQRIAAGDQHVDKFDWVYVYLLCFDLYAIPDQREINKLSILGEKYSNKLNILLSALTSMKSSLQNQYFTNRRFPPSVGGDYGFGIVAQINENISWIKSGVYDLSFQYSMEHHDGIDIFSHFKS